MDTAEDIRLALKRVGATHEEIGKAIGRDRTAATKMFGGKKPRRIQADEIPKLRALIAQKEGELGELGTEPPSLVGAYVEVEVLPTYAGMGGGGSGDADRSRALLPRTLIQDELRADPEQMLLLTVRGDSMEPRFLDGDQILIDRRETNPRQPGPFVLWFDDGFVLKLVEKIRSSGKLRITSLNSAYAPDEADPDEVTIMGRPVWIGRRVGAA